MSHQKTLEINWQARVDSIAVLVDITSQEQKDYW